MKIQRRRFIKSAAFAIGVAGLGRAASAYAQPEQLRDGRDYEIAPQWGDPSTLVSAIAAGTVAVPNVAEMVDAYCEWFSYVEHWSGSITAELADFWGASEIEGRKAAVVGPRDMSRGLLRFVEIGSEFKRIPSYTTLGWTALEIRVKNVDEVVKQLENSPFYSPTGPHDLKFSAAPPTLRAVTFIGPTGELLYLTEDLKYDRSVQIGAENVGPLFIQTLAANPYEATRDFYQRTLAMRMSVEVDVSIENVTAALGVANDRKYKLSAVRAPAHCSIEIDEYPKVAIARPRAPGILPPGACMCSFVTEDIEKIARALDDADISFRRLESNPMPPYANGRSIFCRGASGELVEFVESAKIVY